MKKLATAVFSLALISLASSAFAANQVRISQVYPGGGSGSATYLNDYVEIFNSGATPVNIGGWTIEYGSPTGNWGSTGLNIFTFPQGAVIQPCKYVLVAMSAGTVGAPLPVAPDYTGTNTLGAAAGKVGLFSAVNANLACGSEIPGTLVDKLSWGTANCPEGTNLGALSATTAGIRKIGGMTDTDNNLSDFTVEGSFAPRNSASPGNPECLATPATPQSWGSMKAIYR